MGSVIVGASEVVMWWWAGLLGCVSASRVAALEEDLAAAKAEVEALEKRVAALDAPQLDDADARAARRAELQQRLADRRAAREAARLGGTPGLEEAAAGEATGFGAPTDPLEVLEHLNLTPRQALADPEVASSLGRVLLHVGPDGSYDGYRLSAIRRGSVLYRVGLKNGDIVHSVNGLPLGSMQEAMEAYEAINRPEVTELTLKISRRGSPEELRVPLDEVPPPPAVDPAAPPDGAE